MDRRTRNQHTRALAGLLADLRAIRSLAPEDPVRQEWVELKEGLLAALEEEYPAEPGPSADRRGVLPPHVGVTPGGQLYQLPAAERPIAP